MSVSSCGKYDLERDLGLIISDGLGSEMGDKFKIYEHIFSAQYCDKNVKAQKNYCIEFNNTNTFPSFRFKSN